MAERILFTPTEAADELRLSRSKVYAMIKTGIIPSIRIGGVLRVPADALREHVARATAAVSDGRAA